MTKYLKAAKGREDGHRAHQLGKPRSPEQEAVGHSVSMVREWKALNTGAQLSFLLSLGPKPTGWYDINLSRNYHHRHA